MRTILLFVACLLCAATAAPPNIVLILLDDAGWGDIGANNNETVETKNIDELAKNGLRFTDFHMGASVCTPSRAALLTGRLGLRTGTVQNFGETAQFGLPFNETIIPEYLKASGYATAMIGKWHLGHAAPYHPSFRGFDEYFGLPYSNDMGCTDVGGFNLPMPQPCPKTGPPPPFVNRTITPHTPPFDGLCIDADMDGRMECDRQTPRPEDNAPLAVPLYKCASPKCEGKPNCDATIVEQPVDINTLSTRYGEQADRYITGHKTQPFFLYVGFHHMHVPHSFEPSFKNSSARRTIYGDTLMEADATVGRIVKSLRDNNLMDNTFVFVSSDNGPWNVKCELAGSQGPFRGLWQIGQGGASGKMTTWEGGHRVFAVAHWPGKIKPGVTNALSSSLDLLPTIAKLTGATLRSDVSYDGMDLSNVLFNGATEAHETLFHPQYPNGNITAIRYKQYKAYYQTEGAARCPDGQFTLPKLHSPPLVFDLQNDPSESTPLSPPPQPILDAINEARQKKVFDIMNTKRTHTSYTSGGPPPCCNPSKPACRCQ